MKVKKLFILYVESRDEDDVRHPQSSSLALHRKYSAKLGEGNVTWIHVEIGGQPGSSNWKEYVYIDQEQELKDLRATTTRDVGVYVCAHGRDNGNPRVSTCAPDHFAELIVHLGFPAIRKLCFVCCNSRDNFAPKFCAALADQSGKRLTPLVAAWDGFVSVCAADKDFKVYDKKNLFAEDEKGNKARTALGAEGVKGNDGRKVAKGVGATWDTNHHFLVSSWDDELRQAKKGVFQWEGGGVKARDLKDWKKAFTE